MHAKRALRRPSIESLKERGDIQNEKETGTISFSGSVSVEPFESPWEQTSVVHAKRGLPAPSVEHWEEEDSSTDSRQALDTKGFTRAESVEVCPWDQTSVVYAKRALRPPSLENTDEESCEGDSDER